MTAAVYVALAPIAFFLLAYVVWGFYLAVMNLKRVRDAKQMPATAYRLAIPLLALGYVLDFLLQLFATILFADIPRELTLTYRLKRYKGRTDWRGRLSAWLAAELLDPFDPSGKHV